MVQSGNGDIKMQKRLAMGEKLDGCHADGGRIKDKEDKDVASETKRNPNDRNAMKDDAKDVNEKSSFKKGGTVMKKVVKMKSESSKDSGMFGSMKDHGKSGY